MNNNIRQQIYLGALLHDIGKIYQRAEKKFSDKKNELSDYSKKMAESPINDIGKFGYQHVIWTNEFFEKFKDKLEKIPGIKNNLYSESTFDNIVNFACNHHRPQTFLQSFVSLADWWSAGVDRTKSSTLEKEDDDFDKIGWGKNSYKTIPLFSIFNQINSDRGEKRIKSYRNAFNLKPLSLRKNDIFTHKVDSIADGVSEIDYKKLKDSFEEEFVKLPTDSFDGFTESLLYLLKKYTWAIPSNTMDMANVSLYEHLKTTAAFADCLYSYHLESKEELIFDNQNNRLKLKEGILPVQLVGGDVSGIQKFIYNIASSKAAKSLKGRSFYLQLLIDSIIQKVVSHPEIDATIGHVVYSSGGKFYMLLPNTVKVKAALKSIKEEIEKELWEEHKGKLSVNIDSVAFAFSSNTDRKIKFENQKGEFDLGDLWRALAEKLNAQKNQKFKTLLNIDFFNVNNVGGDIETCAVTGEELDKSNISKGKNGLIISKVVNSQTELGTTLKDADYLITHRDDDKHKYLSKRSSRINNMDVVGVYNYLFDEKELTVDDADFRKITSADVSRVVRFNETNYLSAPLKGNAVSYGFQFYGGNKQAETRRKDIKTFEQLTDVPHNNSETYLGVLRMDVDNLGNIFIKGLDNKDKSFSAYATMSFQLDLFFSGYLNTIRNSDKYKDYVNILYSGGDDVFAVGRWDLLIDFAEDIRKDFAEFIGRTDISISAGISIVRNKYPIAKAAEIAGEAEEVSKEYESKDSKGVVVKKKNAITFLGETISWESEYDEVKSLKDEFLKYVEKGLSKGVLHKLMEFAQIKNTTDDLKYKWHTAYYLKRQADSYKNNKDVREFLIGEINGLQKTLFLNDRSYDLTALAARWAELELREIIKTKN
jgi:CRISPR-associated protein Csm1